MPRRTNASPVTVSASEFKATCLELMDKVASTGRDLVITKRGHPVVRVSAITDAVQSPFGFMVGSIVRHGDIVDADSDEWSLSDTDPLNEKRRR